MRTLIRLSITACFIATTLITTAHPAAAQVFCQLGTSDAACDTTVTYNSESGDGATTPVTCDASDDQPCWVNNCDNTFIADDAARWGVAWNGDPTQRPVPTQLLPFVDDAESDSYAASYVGGGTVGWYAETGQWWTCTEVDAELDEADQLLNPGPNGTTYGPVGGVIDVDALREAAKAEAEPGAPPVQKSTPDGVASIVQASTWFWIEPGWWRTYTGTDTSSTGRMTVTVNATPTDTVWETGEGTLTHCDEGTPLEPGMDPDAPWACSWIYRHSSGWVGHLYRAEATVRSELDWAMTFNNAARSTFDQGPLPDYYSTNGFDIETEEVLAVASAGDSSSDTGFP